MSKQVYAHFEPDTHAWRVMTDDSRHHLFDAASVILGHVEGNEAWLGTITASGAYFASDHEVPEGSDVTSRFKAYVTAKHAEGEVVRYEGPATPVAAFVGKCKWIYLTFEGGHPVRYALPAEGK